MAQLTALVLGSAAGGGSPQWNCRCGVCARVRADAPGTRPRTQTSLAATADGARWVVVGASPDLRQQLLSQARLAPRQGPRHSPVAAVVVTNGDIDQVAGLLTLRERSPFSLYASDAVHEVLAASPLFAALDPALVPRRRLTLDAPTDLLDADGAPLGVTLDAFPVPGKVPLYLEDPACPPATDVADARNVGLTLSARGGPGRLVFVPACARVTPALEARLAHADALLFDGTLYRDDELLRAELGHKTGRRMGHLSVGGPDGAIAALAHVPLGRRVFVHVNNSNPILIEGTPERRAVEAAGWEVAHDGLELTV